jgi:hypothetical protein
MWIAADVESAVATDRVEFSAVRLGTAKGSAAFRACRKFGMECLLVFPVSDR